MTEHGGWQMRGDEELDRALAAFPTDVRVSKEATQAAKRRLVSAIDVHDPHTATPVTQLRAVSAEYRAAPPPPPTRRGLRYGLGAAAAAVALVAGAVLLPEHSDGVAGGPPAPPAAQTPAAQAIELLAQSADLTVKAAPDASRPFRFVETRSWDTSKIYGDDRLPPLTVKAEHIVRVWIPADPDDEWQVDFIATGKYQLVDGGDAALKALEAKHPGDTAKVLKDLGPDQQTERAKAGRFGVGDVPRKSWQMPTPEFLAGLPRDPQKLYDRLRSAASDKPDDPDSAEPIVYAGDLFRSGVAPADLRAALYRALQLEPGLHVTDQATDVDGRTGTALGVADTHGGRQELIIDPRTGEFLGERRTDPDGTGSTSAVTVSGADDLGVVPTG